MAVRLNVLVLRPPGGGSSWHEHCDDLLGNLLGRPGLDVTLLERLPHPEDGSTETLALESIGGHIACLAWQEPQQVVADLANAGRPMLRRPHHGDPACPDNDLSNDAVSATARADRMYFFDMRVHRDSQKMLAALQSLLATLQVPTFQIGGLSAPKSPVKRAAQPPSTPQLAAISPAATTPTLPRDTSHSDALDRLVDQLDELDI